MDEFRYTERSPLASRSRMRPPAAPIRSTVSAVPAPLRGLHAGPGGPLVVAVFAALLYATGLGRLPHPDELYQILAAQGLAATGEPRIADGLYTRAYAQTWLIAWTLRLLGDTVAAARLSSLLAVAATAGLLFAWMRREAGPTAAWLGATGFALSPFAAETALFARIYGVQAYSVSPWPGLPRTQVRSSGVQSPS